MADVNTGFNTAAQIPQTSPLMEAVKNGDAAQVEQLIREGADVNAGNNGGYTPLMWASMFKSEHSLGIAKQLVEAGADIEQKNHMGRTALMIAIVDGQSALVEYLLEKGADTQTADNTGETPLQAAVASKMADIVRLLAEHGAPLDVKDNLNLTPVERAEKDDVPYIAAILRQEARRREQDQCAVEHTTVAQRQAALKNRIKNQIKV